jgi:formiminotetrahydrofolate cyclodeaminase
MREGSRVGIDPPAPLRGVTLDDLLAQLAAPAPSLAGASAAALTAARAAAVVTMVGRGSQDWPEGKETARRADEVVPRLVALATEDARAFGVVLKVSRCPDLDTAGRSEKLAQALLEATEPAVAIAEAAADVGQLAALAQVNGNRVMHADAAAASILAQAAVASAALAVDANLNSPLLDTQADRTSPLRQRMRAASARAGAHHAADAGTGSA